MPPKSTPASIVKNLSPRTFAVLACCCASSFLSTLGDHTRIAVYIMIVFFVASFAMTGRGFANTALICMVAVMHENSSVDLPLQSRSKKSSHVEAMRRFYRAVGLWMLWITYSTVVHTSWVFLPWYFEFVGAAVALLCVFSTMVEHVKDDDSYSKAFLIVFWISFMFPTRGTSVYATGPILGFFRTMVYFCSFAIYASKCTLGQYAGTVYGSEDGEKSDDEDDDDDDDEDADDDRCPPPRWRTQVLFCGWVLLCDAWLWLLVFLQAAVFIRASWSYVNEEDIHTRDDSSSSDYDESRVVPKHSTNAQKRDTIGDQNRRTTYVSPPSPTPSRRALEASGEHRDEYDIRESQLQQQQQQQQHTLQWMPRTPMPLGATPDQQFSLRHSGNHNSNNAPHTNNSQQYARRYIGIAPPQPYAVVNMSQSDTDDGDDDDEDDETDGKNHAQDIQVDTPLNMSSEDRWRRENHVPHAVWPHQRHQKPQPPDLPLTNQAWTTSPPIHSQQPRSPPGSLFIKSKPTRTVKSLKLPTNQRKKRPIVPAGRRKISQAMAKERDASTDDTADSVTIDMVQEISVIQPSHTIKEKEQEISFLNLIVDHADASPV
jgi:hypothetical protein